MISIDREMLWQWDRGQRVHLHEVPVGTAVHFSNAAIKPNALVTEAYEDGGGVYANIPDILLQTAGTLTAYIYIEDGDEGHTEYRKLFIVRDREKPDDYVYTEDDVKTWVSLEERIKVLEESGGGAAGGLIRPLSEIGEIDGVTVVHNAEKDKVTLQVEMTAERVNSLFGGNVVYKSDYPNAQALDILMRSPGMSYMVMWELFEDDFITVTNYPKKKYIMVSTNHMVVSFDYDENGKVTGKRETHQASVQQLNEVKAAVPNRATVNDANELIMQRTEGDAVSELFKVALPKGGGEEKPWRLLDSIDFSKTENQLPVFEWRDLDGVTDIFMFNKATQNGSQTASGYTLWINGTEIAIAFAPNGKSGTSNYWWARVCYDGLVWTPHKSNGAIANNNTLLHNANGMFPYCVFKDVGKAEIINLRVPNAIYQNITGTWEIWVR